MLWSFAVKPRKMSVKSIQFPASVSTALDAHPRAKHFKIGEIWFSAKIPFKGSDFGVGMNQSIVKVD